MANLGTLQTKLVSAVALKPVIFNIPALIFRQFNAGVLKRRVPTWVQLFGIVGSGLSEAPAAAGVLSGAVTTLSVPTRSITIRAYYRATGVLIDSTFSASDGTFSFPQLNSADAGNYFVIAFDNETGVQYNAIIYDRLTPVG